MRPGSDIGEVGAAGTRVQPVYGERRGPDRRRAPGFRTWERRTGFDRRKTYPLTGTLRDEPRVLLGLLVVTNLLSALDFALTWCELTAGLITEGNPVMAGMFAQGPGQAWAFKTAIMLAVSVAIWMGRRHRQVLSAAIFALGVYLAVIGYHMSGLLISR